MFSDVLDQFREDNKVSIEIAKKVESYLKYWGVPSLIPIVNSQTIRLKLPKQYKQLNSTLGIAKRGCGKSTLFDILYQNNPKLFVTLPKKMFESLLIQNPKEFYNGKVMVHDDLISAFSGLNKTQREQLTSFFTQLLSDVVFCLGIVVESSTSVQPLMKTIPISNIITTCLTHLSFV